MQRRIRGSMLIETDRNGGKSANTGGGRPTEYCRMLQQGIAAFMIASAYLLGAGSFSVEAASLKQKSVRLTAGGAPVRVTATGSDATSIVRFYIYRARKRISTVTAIRRVNVGANAIIELRAKPDAVPYSRYILEGRNAAGKRILSARISVVSKISTRMPRAGSIATKPAARNSQVGNARAPAAAVLNAAPVVTSYSPANKAHPGMILVVNGRNLNQGEVTLKLGSGTKTVGLQITRRSPSRLEARIPTTAYTGRRGSPLIIARRGSRSRTLKSNYQVLNRMAVFSGESLWHEPVEGAPSQATSIYVRGRVQIRLDKLEFTDSGGGTYSETAPLAKLARKYTETCQGNGKREVREFRSAPARVNRRISWRRLPDGRIELRGIGISHDSPLPSKAAIASINDRSLTLSYGLPAFNIEVRRSTSCCKPGLLLPQVCIADPKLIPNLTSFVEWSLARRDAL